MIVGEIIRHCLCQLTSWESRNSSILPHIVAAQLVLISKPAGRDLSNGCDDRKNRVAGNISY